MTTIEGPTMAIKGGSRCFEPTTLSLREAIQTPSDVPGAIGVKPSPEL